MENNLQVSNLGEKKLIDRIIKKIKDKNAYSKNGKIDLKNDLNKFFFIGDDAALVDLNLGFGSGFGIKCGDTIAIDSKKSCEDLSNSNSYLVASSDLLIERTHFPKEMSYFQMGWKGVTVNVSDIAAMGAKPVGILISIAIPSDLELKYFDELIDGILAACSYYEIPLIGGDTNRFDEVIISGTALGEAEKEKALLKHGFKNNDLIAITGELGLAALGFEILKSKRSSNMIEDEIAKGNVNEAIVDLAIERTLKPKARLKEGIFLKDFASSATDITDGLASELFELFKANESENPDDSLGMMIYEDKIPFLEEIAMISEILEKDPLDLILHFGEDFELLFTISEENFNDLDRVLDNHDFHVIGKINDKNTVEIKKSDGTIEKLSSKGYEHFT